MSENIFKKLGEIFIDEDKEKKSSFVYVSASLDATYGVTTASNHNLYVIDFKTMQIKSSFMVHTGSISGCCLNDKVKTVCTCSRESNNTTGNEFFVWDVRTCKNIAKFYPDAYNNKVTTTESCAVSIDGDYYCCGTDKGIFSWDIRKPEAKFEHIDLMSSIISSIEFHPFINSTFIAGDDDGNLIIWDFENTENGSNIDEYGLDLRLVLGSNVAFPIFQCGFYATNDECNMFLLERNNNISFYSLEGRRELKKYEDIRKSVDQTFNYPIDAHMAGYGCILCGGDSEGGVAVIFINEENCKLVSKIEKANVDCVNASFINYHEESIDLLLAGDGGHLTFWKCNIID